MTDDGGPDRFRNVLDHGYVRLVDWMGDDLSIVRSARVSHQKDDRRDGEGRLINYLWKHRHTSPFEHVHFTFEIKAPLYVIRQWQRHRTWSFNEVSARYSELDGDYYVPDADTVGVPSFSNKQQRDFAERPDVDDELRVYMDAATRAVSGYVTLLQLGWPRELARGLLPSCVYTRMYASVNLHNLFKFIELRNSADAQYEIQVYAQAMTDLIQPIVPMALAAFKGAPLVQEPSVQV